MFKVNLLLHLNTNQLAKPPKEDELLILVEQPKAGLFNKSKRQNDSVD
jgi:hypothetical protein